MQNRKRLTNILIAGTLTALILSVFLAFRGTNTAVADTASVETAVVETISLEATEDVAALQAQVDALQAQNTELRELLTTMQAREAEYQVQIESANQTINEMSQSGTFGFGSEGAQGRPGHSHDH